MSKSKFLQDWIVSNNYLLKTSATKEWDKIIGDKKTQKDIKMSSNGRQLYAYIEGHFAHDHTRIIDSKLREAYANLSLSDFANPSGFAQSKKASKALLHFFEVHHVLENFIKQDVGQHKNRDSQVNAFRRWIVVANLLKQRECYEGYFLVINALWTLEGDLKFSNELPDPCLKLFKKQCNSISPFGNFAELRREINCSSGERRFTPVFLRAKDLTVLNDVLEDIEDSVQPDEPAYEALRKKQSFLREIAKEQKVKTRLPGYLEKKFQEMHLAFQKQNKRGKNCPAGQDNKIKPEEKNKPSTLYQDLLPSFWRRKCNEKKYWEKVFELNNSPSL
ncbi:hypothetical protein [Legionella jordanis]|uniref:RasGEF domain protein n=1 Tax=Legionella jordanis TaxID=456 RepID=A0A0W0VAZ2_9GAMM|nr:hypothetical protein [Legionella jordanis]KTD17030.1 hypothetical protein Ljor_1336 [Legionella jordanis]RMX03168.1 hypothetical protein EAW55_06980 [Legionella jordanis]RMX18693.1 hypothetical protein EAS68_07715 [Legionella jordanis]VEH12774.1 Uncharacterised protein [Legionella jordanis]HAT8713081.1 hypothetical protein [Legionella jordanis]